MASLSVITALSVLNNDLLSKLIMPPAELARTTSVATECLVKHGVGLLIPEKLELGFNSAEINCFTFCLYVGHGTMLPDGTYNTTKAYSVVPEKYSPYLDECILVRGVNNCDTANKGYNCFVTRLREHDDKPSLLGGTLFG